MTPEFFDHFDESTQDKLDFIQAYLEKSIPAFIHAAHVRELVIADLFSGPGSDQAGKPGTPTLIFNALLYHLKSSIEPARKPIKVFLNDENEALTLELKSRVKEWERLLPQVEFHVSCGNAIQRLPSLITILQNSGSAGLVLLDSFGLEVLQRTNISLFFPIRTCDVIVFAPSSQLNRFPEFFGNRMDIDTEIAKSVSREDIHKFLCSEIGKWARESHSEAYVSGFTLKKKSNIYGIAFLTHSIVGLEKFVRTCWELDPKEGFGNANAHDPQGDLFGGLASPRVVEYKKELRDFLTSGESLHERDLVEFMLTSGMLPCHTEEVIRDLQSRGKLIHQRVRFGAKNFTGGEVGKLLTGGNHG